MQDLNPGSLTWIRTLNLSENSLGGERGRRNIKQEQKKLKMETDGSIQFGNHQRSEDLVQGPTGLGGDGWVCLAILQKARSTFPSPGASEGWLNVSGMCLFSQEKEKKRSLQDFLGIVQVSNYVISSGMTHVKYILPPCAYIFEYLILYRWDHRNCCIFYCCEPGLNCLQNKDQNSVHITKITWRRTEILFLKKTPV